MRKLTLVVLMIVLTAPALLSCATVGGAAVGAGIGSLSGNAGQGALIGGAIGAVVDIVD
ncbi:MAG TPA: hypothetical protein VGH86_12865 [Phenylobacterium sp.]|jgi:hypothetical protein